RLAGSNSSATWPTESFASSSSTPFACPKVRDRDCCKALPLFACPVLESVESALPTRRPGLASQGEGSLFPALHGLYWLLVNLAEHSPLLVIVDDVHWADPPSLGFLLYLCGRLDGLPVLLAVAVRPAESESDLLARLVSWPRPDVLRLR